MINAPIAINQTINGVSISGMTAALEAAECGEQAILKVAYGGSLKDAGLDRHVIQREKLQDIANK